MIKKIIQPYSKFNPEPKKPDFLEQMNLKPGFSGQTATKMNKYTGLYFDGVDDYVVTALSFFSPTYITTDFWIKNSISANWQWILDGGQSIANGSYSILRPSNTNNIVYRYSNGVLATQSITATNILSGYDNKYVNIVIVADYNENQVTFYQNGIIFSSGTMTTPVKPITTYTRLGIYGTASYPFNGTIDEVRIWNRALSAAEILQLYEKQTPLLDPTGSLVLHHDYKRGHAKDLSVHGNNGVVYGAEYR